MCAIFLLFRFFRPTHVIDICRYNDTVNAQGSQQLWLSPEGETEQLEAPHLLRSQFAQFVSISAAQSEFRLRRALLWHLDKQLG